jgi:hypothetical protein
VPCGAAYLRLSRARLFHGPILPDAGMVEEHRAV